ncbi:glycoside hydrolase family 15 protein [Azospirillum rugosum]|uniref:GH15 family glucan-1,4-alpha-glucosidase n=1 Tax=Azospirillum rugosum TaxID=416170 RepID=A0ABS4SFR7_9PROT|nr:glycoside hydrolase family 15 protein [Azospirillum rugosum]MBP2291419.1 GH15 family glucan-1,4-alpha-glucosidase [Azospirillum rugosum]MDQ0525207.1 GH15 family glucan-1,4-alpha-glucosidase [Azospirillum rugosum]
MPSRIEDYALLGDCETAALVSRDGSIDWLCWPRFDSEACFAALLGTPEHGRWQLRPHNASSDAGAKPVRRYRGDSLVLETEYETAEGAVTVVDFMPPRGQASDIVRIVRGRRGRVPMRMEMTIRFDYGCTVPWVSRVGPQTLRAVAGPDMVTLRTPVLFRGEGLCTVSDFTVGEGESVPFVLTYSPSHLPPPEPVDPEAALCDTLQFWDDWCARCTFEGPWRDAVIRSLVTLKALTYRPTGGIVAAPTTSLPEKLGGVRNWDYRYCWLRDATLTLLALMNAGFYEEAQDWREWLMRAVAGSPNQIQIMYGIGGERRLQEWEVPWLPGYEGASPVRIGNAAAGQLQLDIYGELMDAVHQARLGGLGVTDQGWSLQCALIDHLATVWNQPDEGIWEVRGQSRHYTHSKVMAWVAVDRMLKSARKFGLKAPLDRWRALRDAIHQNVCEHGFSPEMNSFVQYYGARHVDAALLAIPLVGFLPITDPRVEGTIAAVEKHLLQDGFLLRYRTEEADDGLPDGEGVFLPCTLWLADAYVLQGRRDEAVALFERVLALCNDLGLLSEEYDTKAKRLVGNFPQAFSHIALVTTAHNLTRGAKPAKQRTQTNGNGGK